MAETFSGSWIVAVTRKATDFFARFIIAGSDASDGSYTGDTSTPPLSVAGSNWSISLESHDSTFPPVWNPSAVSRSATYTLQDSLVVDLDAGGIVVQCRNVDPPINPWHPFVNPYDFTVGKVPGR